MKEQPASIKRVGDSLFFPQICAVYGGRDASIIREERLLFFPYWSLVLIPFGLLPFILAFVFLRKEQKVVYYLSLQGKRKLCMRRSITIGVLILTFVSIFFAAKGFGWFVLSAVILFATTVYLYKKICFPFQFFVDELGDVCVNRLPKEFETEA